jgi:PAS domain S-box-containing protein
MMLVETTQPSRIFGVLKAQTLFSDIFIGLAAAIIGIAVRFALPLSPYHMPTSFVVVMLALVGMFVGIRAGIVTAIVGGMGAWYLFFKPYSWTLSRDDSILLLGYVIISALILAIITLYRSSERRRHLREINAAAWLAAVVDNSDNAVVSKSLDGIIMSWNEGATNLFGYTADEAIGQPMTLIIPEDRLHEEPAILSKLSAGERIDHFETIRQHKDGSLIDISVTVSPVRNGRGEIIGASKIARDIRAEKAAAEKQELQLKEMHHRVRNLFTLATGLVQLSARNATNVDELVPDIVARLMALSRAHQLTLPVPGDGRNGDGSTTFWELFEAILSPFNVQNDPQRIALNGDAQLCNNGAYASVALLFHELATNAAKYGALSTVDGRLVIEISEADGEICVEWTEFGKSVDTPIAGKEGFGATLERATLRAINATMVRHWKDTGLAAEFRMKSASNS